MTITNTKDGGILTVAVSGRLDTSTAPQLDSLLKEALQGITELVMDFAGLEYISSAGLRVLLSAQKVMNRQGSMKVINAADMVKEVFDVTGFSDVLTIE